jgi:hypothetical protein
LFSPLSIPGTEPPNDDGIREAAKQIAGVDDPPDWLLAALVLFSRTVGGDRVTGEDEKQINETLWRARRNIDQLVGFLKKFLPDLTSLLNEKLALDILLALEVLPRIAAAIPQLPPQPHRDGGQRRDQRPRICAGLVVDGWRIVRGSEPAAGKEVYEACQTYWEACGHDKVQDWKRVVQEAVSDAKMRAFLEVFAQRHSGT